MTLSFRIVDEHASYLADRVRLAAYAEAILQVVRPGSVVLDLGAGTGILGLLALRAGAARVYAVDDGPVLDLARAIHAANGTAEQVRFVRGRSTEVSLPERVDVVVADQAAYMGHGAGLVESFEDASRRHLLPGGVLLPAALEIHVALAECPGVREQLAVWTSRPMGLDLSAGREAAISGAPWPARLTPEGLLGPEDLSVRLDLSAPETRAVRLAGTLTVARAGTLDALGGWFVSWLTPTRSMTNSPYDARRIDRSCGILPLNPPVSVEAGDRVDVSVSLDPSTGLNAWSASGVSASGPWRREHSTLDAVLALPGALGALRPSHHPRVGPLGRAAAEVLRLADGTRTLSAVEAEIARLHPEALGDGRAAAAFVRGLLDRYEAR